MGGYYCKLFLLTNVALFFFFAFFFLLFLSRG